MEEKYRIGEEMEELIRPAEHHNRELVTKQESYERILLEEKTAAVTLNNDGTRRPGTNLVLESTSGPKTGS